MSKVTVLSQMNETQSHPAAEARYASAPHAIAPDPVMIERIGKGLHELYDGVPKSTLPIYFGPVLGELYLTPVPRRRSA
ncbi:MAG: hypothetical protein QOF41_1996 [Methylobacteriaceae bacterium]|jgi:hypothetical protein|nr:hypothetical protein [Methylobacteriaceae bacterium]